jgi:hypothetical protein
MHESQLPRFFFGSDSDLYPCPAAPIRNSNCDLGSAIVRLELGGGDGARQWHGTVTVHVQYTY